MTLTARIRKQGGATVFSIPPALLKMMGADVGTELSLSVDNGVLIATPSPRKRRLSLAELLEGTEEVQKLSQQTTAWETAPATGKEAF